MRFNSLFIVFARAKVCLVTLSKLRGIGENSGRRGGLGMKMQNDSRK